MIVRWGVTHCTCYNTDLLFLFSEYRLLLCTVTSVLIQCLLQDEEETFKTDSERLLATTEQIGRLHSDTLDVDTNETVRTTLEGSNIG